MVRRGSTVRVRQRALQKRRNRRFSFRLDLQSAAGQMGIRRDGGIAPARILSGDALLGGAEDEITSELGGDQSAISWRVEECVRATKGDGVAFPGEADCIEVELADRLVRGCYPVGKAVAVN
jgi:hypothetical protein